MSQQSISPNKSLQNACNTSKTCVKEVASLELDSTTSIVQSSSQVQDIKEQNKQMSTKQVIDTLSDCINSDEKTSQFSDKTGSFIDDELVNHNVQSLPAYNVPEKIIIVLDRANDENHTFFETISGKKYDPLFMLQHALKVFLHNKTVMDSRHEFALVVLNENSAVWVHDFTSHVQDIIASVQTAIECPCEPEDIFDLSIVFNLINEKLHLSCSSDLSVPPAFVARTVFLYGRSYSIPELTRTSEIERLLNSPYFIVDIVMTHEPPDSANHCVRIFKLLQEIDTKGFAYSFSVSRNASELHRAMAEILSHPLQRSHQVDAVYNICSFK